MRQHERKVKMISIDRINVLNPRERSKIQHRDITNNISDIGLKRPITVSRRTDSDETGYDLVCGQGRLEAFLKLGASEIPAIVIDASEADCLVMSLVENIARRRHRPIDLMREVGHLHKRGYSDTEIAAKIGVTANWAGSIVNLLERGEERLVSAVETGLIPISFAIDIARAPDSESQNLLMEAYAGGEIKGKKLGMVRRMLDRRQKHSKEIGDSERGPKVGTRKLTSGDLTKLYQREAEKQQILIKKSNYTQASLLFIVQALKELMADSEFTALLRAAQLETMPRALAMRISRERPDDEP
ncbi:plasmid partitioning protein RepB C-terminal domain-containing protein [Methylovirgula sp. HY1]|uniref:plasmid partitioning protein RepB C-terminal domain-containing protein n=1 Tax=Methylovirgula sp. HY1 TaxID=2822761 RepID=UPI001C7540CE|nr:plasmid partitioning protein RepB C-terminal domain-containing protein [Methylovirgula sp. HY1]QXX76123.1 Chromosome-partitioning protein Spo0J [Methylovirgula sp. HY1]